MNMFLQSYEFMGMIHESMHNFQYTDYVIPNKRVKAIFTLYVHQFCTPSLIGEI